MGGGTRVIATLANLLSEAGYPTRVVAVHRDRKPRREWFSEKVEIVQLSGRTRWHRLMSLFQSLPPNEGVVFSCCEFTSLLVPWFRVLRRQRFALVIVVHVDLGQLLESERGNRGLQSGMRFAGSAYARADLVAAVSGAAAAELEKRLRLPHVDVLYNPVVDPLQLRDYHPPMPQQMHDLPRPIILNAGRLHPQKDQTTLIKAFLRLAQGSLVLLGEGPDRRELEEFVARSGASSRVWIPGNVDNPLDYMYHSDLFVLSSRYEGLPTVLIEAMGVGCAVVSTDCPSGPREILENGRYGTLVPVGDVDALAEAMASTLSNPGDKSRLRAAANRFSYESSLAEYVSVIRKLSD